MVKLRNIKMVTTRMQMDRLGKKIRVVSLRRNMVEFFKVFLVVFVFYVLCEIAYRLSFII